MAIRRLRSTVKQKAEDTLKDIAKKKHSLRREISFNNEIVCNGRIQNWLESSYSFHHCRTNPPKQTRGSIINESYYSIGVESAFETYYFIIRPAFPCLFIVLGCPSRPHSAVSSVHQWKFKSYIHCASSISSLRCRQPRLHSDCQRFGMRWVHRDSPECVEWQQCLLLNFPVY